MGGYGRYTEDKPLGQENPGMGPCVRCGQWTDLLPFCVGCGKTYQVDGNGIIVRRFF